MGVFLFTRHINTNQIDRVVPWTISRLNHLKYKTMEKNTIIINNSIVNFDNYGSNNYSHDMQAVVFNPKDIDKTNLESTGIFFIHPTLESNNLEIFALMGTKAQFDIFKPDAIESYCTKKACDKYGFNFDDEKINILRHEMIKSLKATLLIQTK